MDLQRFKVMQKELEELKNLEKQHQRINGKMRVEVSKLTKENEYLKKENTLIREGNERLGVYRKDNKLSEHQKTKPNDA